jgi:hypothetical protein
MVRATAYKEPLEVYRPGLEEVLNHEDWQAPVESNTPDNPYSARYSKSEDEPADIVFYSDGQISRLRRRYEFRGGTAVENFLLDHSYLIQPLSDAYYRIREYFGPRTGLVLKVARDPEARQDRELFVAIQTGLSPRAARTLLAELDRVWWRDAFPNTQGKLTIGLEYV